MPETWRGIPLADLVPAEALVPGMTFTPVEYSGAPVAALLLVKVIDEDGDIYWTTARTSGFSDEEAIGALELRAFRLKASIQESGCPSWCTEEGSGA